MKTRHYEETLYIEEGDIQQEIIRLFDLDRALVLDYIEDEFHIALVDMSTGGVIKKFPYGDEYGLDGFSFSVSPRHNYLIIKEAVYGQSLDNLYATVYCLKEENLDDDEKTRLSNRSDYGQLTTVNFHSHYYLNFLFSGDQNEDSIWVQGQGADNLELIDCFQYGGRKKSKTYPLCQQVMLYKIESYPSVALDHDIRDGKYLGGLSDHTVVNDLDIIKQNHIRTLVGIESDEDLKNHLLAVYATIGDEQKGNNFFIQHKLSATSNFQSSTQALKTTLDNLNIECFCLQYIAENTQLLESIVAHSEVSHHASSALQSIALISKLCEENGLIYEGYRLVTNNKCDADMNWSAVIEFSFSHYKELVQSVINKKMSFGYFITRYYLLLKKHQQFGIEELLNKKQRGILDRISLDLSRFDDYEIKEEQVIDTLIDIQKS